MEYTKKCTVCGKELPATIEFFNRSKLGRYGLKSECKICRKKEYLKNKTYYSLKNKENYNKNKKQRLEYRKNYYKENKEKIHKQNKKWRNENKNKILEKNKIYTKERRKKDPAFKILLNIRSRLGNSIKGSKKSHQTIELLGCSVKELKSYLESKFLKGMNWDNYGKSGWHIDHIKPCCGFDLTKPEQQKECFHYTNLQPLWALDNFRKGGKIP